MPAGLWQLRGFRVAVLARLLVAMLLRRTPLMPAKMWPKLFAKI